jgi:hypothetical protein
LFNTLVTPLYFLQIVAGWTRLSVGKNIVAVVIILPTLLYFVPRIGPYAPAGCWIAVNFGYYLFEVPLMHRRLLKGHMSQWWLGDTLIPMIATAIVFGCSWLLIPADQKPWFGFLQAALTSVVSFLAIGLLFPTLRRDAIEAAHRFILGHHAGRMEHVFHVFFEGIPDQRRLELGRALFAGIPTNSIEGCELAYRRLFDISRVCG